MTLATKQAELPPLKGYNRTPFVFYVADHKAPVGMTWPETAEWHQREGEILIPNSYWSRIATLSREELEAIENPDVRKETEQAQRLMLEYPAQFVNLMIIGNRTLIEPYGLGVRTLSQKLRTGDIEVYDHDASKIVLGQHQEKYNNAKLLADESAKDYDVRFAVRAGCWLVGDGRFYVGLDSEPWYSLPIVAGLGFRPEGNQAYVDVGEALKSIAGAKQMIEQAERALR